MIVTGTSARRRAISRVAGAAAAFSAVAVLPGGLLSAGVGASVAAAVSVDVPPARESTAALDESASAAKRRTNTSNTSDYLTVVLKEAG